MGNRRSRLALLTMVLTGLIGLPPVAGAAPSEPGATTQASVSLTGSTAVGTYATPRVGNWLSFVSTATNLDVGDTNGVADIFLSYDGFMTRIPRDPDRQLNGPSSQPALGRKVVVFSSMATNFDPDVPDTNGVQDILGYWDENDSLFRISVSTAGVPANGASSDPSASDGSPDFEPVYVAYGSSATNLVSDDTNGFSDVFVTRFGGRLTTRVSVAGDGGQADTGASTDPDISWDGRFVAFTSEASDLVPGDTNGVADIFVRDLTAGTTSRVSVRSNGGQSDGVSSDPTIVDGRYVVFVSTDNDLADGASQNTGDVYVRDLVDGTTRRVSVSSTGEPANAASSQPAVEWPRVAFTSAADNLVHEDTNGRTDVFLRDLDTATTTRVSVSSNGAQSQSNSHSPAVSSNADGSIIAFVSEPNGGLVPGDFSQTVLVRRPEAPPTPFGDFDADGLSDVIARTATGQLHLFRGTGAGLAPPVRIGASGWGAMNAITRLGDFDLDGREDVIARETATGALWLYPGRRSYFAPRVRIGASGWNGMREITAVGDLNADGNPDLVAVQSSTGDLYLYPGRGTGFGPRRLFGRGGWNSMDELTGVGDLNRNGHPGLVARQPSTGDLWLYPGAATGTSFARRERIGLGWNGMRDLVGVGDSNRDGTLDIAAVQKNNSQLFVYQGGGFRSGPAGTGFTSGRRPIL